MPWLVVQAFCVANSYKPVDRDQLFLLPPDMREWLGANHLAFFVIEVVERIDTSALHASHPNAGPGRRAYDPDMLLSLLLYAYAAGERSSRRIERLCEVDVAFRVIAANLRPDHTTIARFRADNESAIAGLFTEVLRLCAEAGLLSLGVIAVDGTRMKANASRSANKTREQVEKILAEATEKDAEEDAAFGERRGDELPEALADPHRRKARLDEALKVLKEKEAKRRAAESQREERVEKASARRAARAEQDRRRAEEAERNTLAFAEEEFAAADAEHGYQLFEWMLGCEDAALSHQPMPRRPDGRRVRKARRRLERLRASPPPPPPPPPSPRIPRPSSPPARQKPLRANVTDPDSQLMKTRGGYVQGYNAQAAVDEKGVIISAGVTKSHTDAGECRPMMRATQDELDRAGVDAEIGTMLFDAGYLSAANIEAPGPDRLIATKKSWKLTREAREKGFLAGSPPVDATPIARMEHRLRTEQGAELYGLRQQIVEPAFGDVKENRGCRDFVRRGLAACDAEWKLICMAKNVTKLFKEANLRQAGT